MIGNRLQTVAYNNASAAQLAQKWRFDATGVFQVFDHTTQSMVCVGFDSSYYAINVNCGSNPPIIFRPPPVKYAAPVQGVVLKNVQTQECVVGGTSGNIQLGGCNSVANLVSINATGVIQLLVQPSTCLQASTFERSSFASVAWCNANSNGQHIQLKQVDGAPGKYLLMNSDPATCWENSSGTLTSSGCDGYDQQIWSLSPFTPAP